MTDQPDIRVIEGGGECLYCGEDPEAIGHVFDDRTGNYRTCWDCGGTGRATCAVCDRRLDPDDTVTVVRKPVHIGDSGSEQGVCEGCMHKEWRAAWDASMARIERLKRIREGSLELQLAESLRELKS